MSKRLAIVVGVAVAGVLALASTAGAATLTVTNTHDSGPGSLRTRIAQANSGASFDTIKIEATGTIRVASQLPPLTSDMAIRGPGASKLTVERRPGTSYPILGLPHRPSRASVKLRGVTIGHGSPTVHGRPADIYCNRGSTLALHRTTVRDSYYGIWIRDCSLKVGHGTFEDNGDGIFGNGNVTVSRSSFRDNFNNAIDHYSGGGTFTVRRSTLRGDGFGIENSGGTLTVSRSTLRGGGGVRNFSGVATVARSTLSGNAVGIDGVEGISRTAVTQSTLSGNTYGLEVDPPPICCSQAHASIPSERYPGVAAITLESTIVANSRLNCSNVVASRGHNLADDNSCNLSAPTDQPAMDPRLLALGNYGGPTQTFALKPSSPAIDAGLAAGATTDQRGLPRRVDYPGVPKGAGGDNSDIGAFELQAPHPGQGAR